MLSYVLCRCYSVLLDFSKCLLNSVIMAFLTWLSVQVFIFSFFSPIQVFFINFPTGLLCGEIKKAYVEFVNVSKCPLTALKVVSKHPEFFTFGGNTAVLTPLSPSASENCSAYKTVVTDPTSVRTALLSSASSADFGVGTGGSPEVIQVPLPDAVLLPGASVQLPMWLRGPDEEGVHEINFLFYYESIKKHSKMW